MGKPKHRVFPVKDLCGRGTCEKRGQNGNSGRLGELGKVVADRNRIYRGRRGANRPEFRGARKGLGTASATGTPCELVGYDVQAHHMISKKEHKDQKKSIYQAGWDIDNGRNCILMPKYCGFQMWDLLQYHRGKHCTSYFARIARELKEIVKKYPQDKWCDLDEMKKFHGDLHNLEDDLFSLLKRGMKIGLYDISPQTWTNDYKDERGESVAKAALWMGNQFRKKTDWYFKRKKMPKCPFSQAGVDVSLP